MSQSSWSGSAATKACTPWRALGWAFDSEERTSSLPPLLPRVFCSFPVPTPLFPAAGPIRFPTCRPANAPIRFLGPLLRGCSYPSPSSSFPRMVLSAICTLLPTDGPIRCPLTRSYGVPACGGFLVHVGAFVHACPFGVVCVSVPIRPCRCPCLCLCMCICLLLCWCPYVSSPTPALAPLCAPAPVPGPVKPCAAAQCPSRCAPQMLLSVYTRHRVCLPKRTAVKVVWCRSMPCFALILLCLLSIVPCVRALVGCCVRGCGVQGPGVWALRRCGLRGRAALCGALLRRAVLRGSMVCGAAACGAVVWAAAGWAAVVCGAAREQSYCAHLPMHSPQPCMKHFGPYLCGNFFFGSDQDELA